MSQPNPLIEHDARAQLAADALRIAAAARAIPSDGPPNPVTPDDPVLLTQQQIARLHVMIKASDRLLRKGMFTKALDSLAELGKPISVLAAMWNVDLDREK